MITPTLDLSLVQPSDFAAKEWLTSRSFSPRTRTTSIGGTCTKIKRSASNDNNSTIQPSFLSTCEDLGSYSLRTITIYGKQVSYSREAALIFYDDCFYADLHSFIQKIQSLTDKDKDKDYTSKISQIKQLLCSTKNESL